MKKYCLKLILIILAVSAIFYQYKRSIPENEGLGLQDVQKVFSRASILQAKSDGWSRVFDEKNEYLLKEYIPGLTATEVIGNNKISDGLIGQLFDMFSKVKNAGLNIDYFPSNFVISDSKLYYIDYEFNIYTKEWDLLNWGIYYWANYDGMALILQYFQ